MSIANKTGWQQEFTVAVSILVLKSGLNAQAIKRARNRLEQEGFITWRSRGGNQSAIYHLNSLVVQNECKNVPQSVPQDTVVQNNIKNVPQYEPQTEPQTEPQYEPQSVPINKHKRNKTKTKDRPPISPAEKFEEFCEAYPKKVNLLNTNAEYVSLLKTTTSLTEDDLIAAAKNYAETCRVRNTGEQYIKNPNNWLRESIWIDYLPENYRGGENSGNVRNNNKSNHERSEIEQMWEEYYKETYRE